MVSFPSNDAERYLLYVLHCYLEHPSPETNMGEEDLIEHKNGASMIAIPEVSDQKENETISYKVDPADRAD